MTWPDPTANALARAQAIARSYRAELAKHSPGAAERLDDAARRVGEGWVCGAAAAEACTVRDAAALLGVTDSRVRQLIDAGKLRSAGKDNRGHALLVADVITYRQSQRVAPR